MVVSHLKGVVILLQNCTILPTNLIGILNDIMVLVIIDDFITYTTVIYFSHYQKKKLIDYETYRDFSESEYCTLYRTQKWIASKSEPLSCYLSEKKAGTTWIKSTNVKPVKQMLVWDTDMIDAGEVGILVMPIVVVAVVAIMLNNFIIYVVFMCILYAIALDPDEENMTRIQTMEIDSQDLITIKIAVSLDATNLVHGYLPQVAM